MGLPHAGVNPIGSGGLAKMYGELPLTADQSLQPDMSNFSHSPQNYFMYEQDHPHQTNGYPVADPNFKATSFQYPTLTPAPTITTTLCQDTPVTDDIGGDQLGGYGNSQECLGSINYLNQSMLSAVNFANSFSDSCLGESFTDTLWGSHESDFFGPEDLNSPLQNAADDAQSPTLAQLNMDDSQPAFDGLVCGPADLLWRGLPQPGSQRDLLNTNLPPSMFVQLGNGKTAAVPTSGQQQVSGRFSLMVSGAKQQGRQEKAKAPAAAGLKRPGTPVGSEDGGQDEGHLRHLLVEKKRGGVKSGGGGGGHRHPTPPVAIPRGAKLRKMAAAKMAATSRVKAEPLEETADNSSLDRKWEEIKTIIHAGNKQEDALAQKEAEETQKQLASSQGYLNRLRPYQSSFANKSVGGGRAHSPKSEDDEDEEDDESVDSHDEGFASDQEQGEEEELDSDDDLDDGDSYDPEFSPKKSSAKARKSDCDDWMPNPKRLQVIGNELRKLNEIISDLTPVSELPLNARPKSRKEKNKLASRACRLKKKAQHESNKVKLYGLTDEHQRLNYVISTMKKEIHNRVQNQTYSSQVSLASILDRLVETSLGPMVAGHTSEFVNSVVEKTAAGNPSGGLDLPK